LLLAVLTTASGCRAVENFVPGWHGFRTPVAQENNGLYAAEPYQPGKMPVVLVHGLLSDIDTWDVMLAELRADPVLAKHYQFWTFRYPTGISYLKSAGMLRSELNSVRQRVDPDGTDEALNDMVLVGHSMGGLLCRLQVAPSEDVLWNSVSKVPFENFQADSDTRTELERVFFFEPNPLVKRVVFIATPHAGSSYSENWIGRLGARAVYFPRRMQEKFEQVMANNAAALRQEKPAIIPTSVDHLSPKSPVMQAVAHLPFQSAVHLHSILGEIPDDRYGGDSVVSKQSAKLPGVDSELVIAETHASVHRNAQAIREVRRILIEHLHARKQ